MNGWIDRRIERVFMQHLLPKGEECYDFHRLKWLLAGTTSCAYALEHMRETPRFANAAELLLHCVREVALTGLFVEFGVFSGHTINQIAAERPDLQIHGFDSFEGLPGEWFPGVHKGTFDRGGRTPPVSDNVRLHVGWFDQTLPRFRQEHEGEVAAFIHMDCDIYSSTKTVLDNLEQAIVPGTIIVFDEYMNFPTWEEHEYKAWQEFVARRGLRYEYIGVVPSHMKAAVRVL